MKDEKARVIYLRSLPMGASVPTKLCILIRDPSKNPTPTEKEALRANRSLYDAVVIAEAEWEASFI